MNRLQVCAAWEVLVSSVDQPEHPEGGALAGQAMIERAKSVIVVALRVNEDRAAQILLDAACQADIPVRLAADQVMTALRADAEHDILQDTLVRALGAVRPVDRPDDDLSWPAPPQPAGVA